MDDCETCGGTGEGVIASEEDCDSCHGSGIQYEPPAEEDGPPSTFTLSIELGNEAMDTRADLARTLHKLAGRLESLPAETQGPIMDDNGNTVGSFAMEAPRGVTV